MSRPSQDAARGPELLIALSLSQHDALAQLEFLEREFRRKALENMVHCIIWRLERGRARGMLLCSVRVEKW